MPRPCQASSAISRPYGRMDQPNPYKFSLTKRSLSGLAGITLLLGAAVASAADTTKPSVPGGLRKGSVTTNTVTLAWNRSTDNVGVRGYTVYRNDVLYSKTTGTSMQVKGLKPGVYYKFRVSAYDAVPNHSSWTATPLAVKTLASSTTTPTTVAPSTSTGATFSCSFNNSPRECGFGEQAKASPRASLVSTAREGSTAVRLRTLPGDSNVYGSGSAERDDLALSQAATGCYQGATQWWSHSVRFPDDYIIPPSGGTWHWGLVFNFHHTGSTGQANLQVVSLPTGLVFWVAGGSRVVNGPGDPGHFAAKIGPIVKNTWYDFVYNVKWSSGTDGFIKGWVNGVLKLNYKGPTLYSGQGCYLKLANYHSPLGSPVSVIHDRIKRGTSATSVSNRALQ
jgi:hypothetical protein